MKTYLRLLWVAFWMLPIQRLCTVAGLGLALAAAVFHLPFGMPGSTLPAIFLGVAIALLPLLLLGGAFWRALSAPRAVSLAPHGRAKLLAAAWAVAVTAVLLWLASYALSFLDLLPKNRMGLHGYGVAFLGAFAFASAWGIASFIASRSPLAMLVVLLAGVGFSYGSVMLTGGSPGETGVTALTMPVLLLEWIAFGFWYLRARRIAPPGWLLPGGQSVFATVASAAAIGKPLSQTAALERLLLGGASVPRIVGQWLLAGVLLLALQLVLARLGEASEPVLVAHVLFASLVLGPVIVAVQSLAIVRRARALWLPSGYSRAQLFAFTERTLLKFALGMALVFALLLLVLWATQPWHPALSLVQALGVMLLPALVMAAYALSRPGGWRAPVVIAVLWATAWLPLTSGNALNATSWRWLVVDCAVILALHALAQRRWLADDLPRAVTSSA